MCAVPSVLRRSCPAGCAAAVNPHTVYTFLDVECVCCGIDLQFVCNRILICVADSLCNFVSGTYNAGRKFQFYISCQLAQTANIQNHPFSFMIVKQCWAYLFSVTASPRFNRQEGKAEHADLTQATELITYKQRKQLTEAYSKDGEANAGQQEVIALATTFACSPSSLR